MEWINYKYSEVKSYHPICEKALNNALKNLNISKDYEVVHHKVLNKLEMDYVILNKETKKILCVIEVKRTPADIHSARYQYQALNYVLNALEICEKPYYILTNLEYAFLFRYEQNRERPYNQMLEPGIVKIAKFEENSKKKFTDKLTMFYEIHIKKFLEDNYKYSISLKDFNEKMLAVKNDETLWESTLIYLLYEYIRGAFVSVGRNDLRDIRRFNKDIKSICSEAIEINFDGIFDHQNLNNLEIKNNLLSEVYNLGNKNVTGDDIAESLHRIVSEGKEHHGEVPTDMELARILSIISKEYINNKNFDEKDFIICDPAAGSGNLISAAIKTFNIPPNNIICNDKNSLLIQLLSLRLGLIYVETINNSDTPNITNKDIIDLDYDYFQDVNLLVLNPPFVSGLYSITRKKELFAKIKSITGKESFTDIGQIGLEIPFLEALNIMTPNETIFGIILPLTYLFSRGPEGKRTRTFLLNKFGLKCIFTFPKEGAFDDVSKGTCILIGSKSFIKEEYVEIYSSYDNISDLNLDNLANSISSDNLNSIFKDLEPGIEGKELSKSVMLNSINEGWRYINSDLTEAVDFVNDYIELNENLIKLEDLEVNIIRGNAGNSGGSNLIFKPWESIEGKDK